MSAEGGFLVVGMALVVVGLVISVFGPIELRQRRSRLKGPLASLVRLKEEGTRLLNNEAGSLAERQGRADSWEEEVARELVEAGATEGEVSDIRTIISFKPVGPAANDEQALFKGMLAERLHRLRVIIKRLEGNDAG